MDRLGNRVHFRVRWVLLTEPRRTQGKLLSGMCGYWVQDKGVWNEQGEGDRWRQMGSVVVGSYITDRQVMDDGVFRGILIIVL